MNHSKRNTSKMLSRRRATLVAAHAGRGAVRWLASQPSSKRETLRERNDRLRAASEAKLEESRQKLMDDVSKRSDDMGALREAVKAKTTTIHPPPKKLYAQQGAFHFPELSTESLAGESVLLAPGGLFRNQWTLLGCAGSQFAQPMVDSWLDAAAGVPAAASGAPAIQTRWVSLVEGVILGWLKTPLLMGMRASVQRERHEHFLCHFGDVSDARRILQMQNKYLGYVCLVDPRGVVRWHVHGNETASEQEVQLLTQLMAGALAADASTVSGKKRSR